MKTKEEKLRDISIQEVGNRVIATKISTGVILCSEPINGNPTLAKQHALNAAVAQYNVFDEIGED